METSTSSMTTQHLVCTVGLDEVGGMVALVEIQSSEPIPYISFIYGKDCSISRSTLR